MQSVYFGMFFLWRFSLILFCVCREHGIGLAPLARLLRQNVSARAELTCNCCGSYLLGRTAEAWLVSLLVSTDPPGKGQTSRTAPPGVGQTWAADQ